MHHKILHFDHSSTTTYHQYIWDGLEELNELVEAVVGQLALTAKVVVVGGDEPAEGHATVGLVSQQVHHLLSKLLGTLHLLRCALWRAEVQGWTDSHDHHIVDLKVLKKSQMNTHTPSLKKQNKKSQKVCATGLICMLETISCTDTSIQISGQHHTGYRRNSPMLKSDTKRHLQGFKWRKKFDFKKN